MDPKITYLPPEYKKLVDVYSDDETDVILPEYEDTGITPNDRQRFLKEKAGWVTGKGGKMRPKVWTPKEQAERKAKMTDKVRKFLLQQKAADLSKVKLPPGQKDVDPKQLAFLVNYALKVEDERVIDEIRQINEPSDPAAEERRRIDANVEMRPEDLELDPLIPQEIKGGPRARVAVELLKRDRREKLMELMENDAEEAPEHLSTQFWENVLHPGEPRDSGEGEDGEKKEGDGNGETSDAKAGSKGEEGDGSRKPKKEKEAEEDIEEMFDEDGEGKKKKKKGDKNKPSKPKMQAGREDEKKKKKLKGDDDEEADGLEPEKKQPVHAREEGEDGLQRPVRAKHDPWEMIKAQTLPPHLQPKVYFMDMMVICA